jgi:hypothetical protein
MGLPGLREEYLAAEHMESGRHHVAVLPHHAGAAVENNRVTFVNSPLVNLFKKHGAFERCRTAGPTALGGNLTLQESSAWIRRRLEFLCQPARQPPPAGCIDQGLPVRRLELSVRAGS